MGDERLWERLVEFLHGWSTATEVEPVVTIPFGDFDAAAQEVRATVRRMEELERYLVYGQYELVPSATPDLPIDPQAARLSELARQHPEGIGRWVVMDRDGNVIDELGPPPG